MPNFPTGVALEAFGLPVRKALERAAAAGAAGIEFSPTAGDLAPDNLSQTGRRDLRRLIERHRLRLFALDARLPGLSLADPHRADEVVDRTMPILRLAADLRVPVVVTRLGRVGTDPEAAPRRTAAETLQFLGDAADRFGVRLAPVTGPDPGEVLADLLGTLTAGGLGVAFHPGMLVSAGLDPAREAPSLGARLVHAYAADVTTGPDGTWRPARIGEGAVDWESVIAALAQVDYAGPLVVPPPGDAGRSPAEVERAIAFLARF